MFSGNFRILIFIDLLATALGSSLILMMIMSVSQKKSAPPAGKATNYVMYRVWTDDENAFIKVLVKNGDSNTWLESEAQELADTIKGTFLTDGQKTDVYVWGPSNEYGYDRGLSNRRHKNVYTVYSPSEKPGKWTFAVLYYNHKGFNSAEVSDEEIGKSIVVHQEFSSLDTAASDTAHVTIGGYAYRTFTVKTRK